MKGHVDKVTDANKHMKRTKHMQRQQFAATEVTEQMQKIPSDKHSMWDLLRAYKTDHTESTLPEQTMTTHPKTNGYGPSGP